MSIRLVFSGDWQASLTNLDRCQQSVDQVCQLLTQHPDASYFIHLGDVKEHRNPWDVRVTNFIISAFTQINESCKGFFFVRGNHDNITTQDDSPSCIPLLHKLNALAIADDKCISVRIADVGLFLVPYFRDPNRQRDEFTSASASAAHWKKKDPKVTRILCFHNEVAGCARSNTCTGDAYTAEELGAAQYSLCVGGHIHKPQFLAPNIYYAGSPFPCDWAECNQEKRLLVVDIQENRK